MSKMKESGFGWIGEIPDSWKTNKGKYLFKLRTTKGNNTNLQLLSPTQHYGVIPQNLYDELSGMNSVKVKENTDISLFRTIHKGDFCISLRSFEGGFEFSNYEGVVSPAYQVFFAITTDTNNDYYKYLFKCDAFIKEMNSYTLSLRDGKNIAFSDFGNTYIPIPPLNTQKQIAEFLDKKCKNIEELKRNIEDQINILELYKRSIITETVTKGIITDVNMKETGIKWIGKIPEHWKIKKGKYILKPLEKPVKPTDGVITCFRDGEVTLRSKRREDGFTISTKEVGYQGIDIGDLVVHGMDGFAGAIGISDSRGKASPVLNVLESKENKKYLMYYLRSMAYGDIFLALATGIRVRSCDLRWNKLAELPYPIPPIEEQNEIVKYIDSILNKTNNIIKSKKLQLEKLEEYKKSLIFEYVTGKREV